MGSEVDNKLDQLAATKGDRLSQRFLDCHFGGDKFGAALAAQDLAVWFWAMGAETTAYVYYDMARQAGLLQPVEAGAPPPAINIKDL